MPIRLSCECKLGHHGGDWVDSFNSNRVVFENAIHTVLIPYVVAFFLNCLV